MRADAATAVFETSRYWPVAIGAVVAITFKVGRVQQNNFNDYQVARMNIAPRDIQLHPIPSDFGVPLGGVGEPGVPPIAPALCNAIFAATRKRIRRLPIADQLKA
jgi:isoquinoline 1-oxidoreductase subunit beta